EKTSDANKEIQVSMLDMLGQAYNKQNNYSAAKAAFQKAATILKEVTSDTTYVSSLLGHAKIAEEHEAEDILKHDKDIQELKHMQITLQKTSDLQLLQIATRLLPALYDKLVDPKLTSSEKTKLINDFMERWNKYYSARTSDSLPPEMSKAVNGGLAGTVRNIREMFAAQAAAQQAASPT